MSSGYGWYSLSGIVMTSAYGAEWGSVALLNDLLREFFALVVIPLLIIGWFMVRDRVNEIARVRDGYTGAVPVIAARPVVKKLVSEPHTHIALDEFADDEDHGTTHKGHHGKP